MSMMTRELGVRFVTPAFLGNAEQVGQWRTPPFKALLRQWWRVAWAEANDYPGDVDRLRDAEGRLFGSAADGTGSRSQVRMRLERWDIGKLAHWENDRKVRHPEVGSGGALVGSQLYLGYGPLTYDRQHHDTSLKRNAAIQAGEEAKLRLAYPTSDAGLLDRALGLMDHYGTLGGRSRNGWGSLRLEGESFSNANPPLRDWRDCLDRDWPHAIGRDNQGALIWRTEAFEDWRGLMQRLAEFKIGLRTQFKFHNGNNAPAPEERHWLSHPVTKHNVRPWRQGRLPNSLRFKACGDADGRLSGLIFHVPCLPPAQFAPNGNGIEEVWRKVHRYLDDQRKLSRISR